jgi:hypothetical protein
LRSLPLAVIAIILLAAVSFLLVPFVFSLSAFVFAPLLFSSYLLLYLLLLT